jgi:hypothetical protein
MCAALASGCGGSSTSGGAAGANPPSTRCGDPWVTQAVQEVTGVTPVGNVCNIYLYGHGSWRSYDELKGDVRTTLGVCSDRWVSQAFIQVVGRQPTSAECNINLYGHGSWNSYADLVGKVESARGLSGPSQPHRTVDNVTFLPFNASGETGLVGRYHLLQQGGNLTGPIPGGEVSNRPYIYALYWGPAWRGRDDLIQYFNGALRMMGEYDYAGKLSQYGVGKATDVGYWVDSDQYDSAVGTSRWVFFGRQLPLTGSEIGKIHSNASSGIPRVWLRPENDPCSRVSDPVSPIIMIFTVAPQHDDSGWLGYHWYTGERSSPCMSLPSSNPYGSRTSVYPQTHGYLPYAFVKVPENAFTSSSPTDVRDAVDAATMTASHEYVEATTNPIPWRTFVDFSQAGGFQGEAGDKCDDESALQIGSFAFTGRGPITGRIVNGPFTMNSYWSNAEGGCIHSP